VIVRFERWGAWVKLETLPAVVALDREGVRALGLDGGDAWERTAGPSSPLEVHVAVTARCGAGCTGCYLDARPDGQEPTRETLERTLDALREAGVFTVAFGGGEPIAREDLDQLATLARARGLAPVLTTSGLGLSEARVEKLRGFAQVNVSYDGGPGTYERVRGFDGSGAAEGAIQRLSLAGVRVGVNVVLTRANLESLEETVARARSLGAVEAQLLRYKPAGRAASLDYLARRLTPDQAQSLGPLLRKLASAFCDHGDFHLRIDCALVPFLSADAELVRDPTLLTRFGVMGCEAAGALAAVTAEGRVAPCSFAPSTGLAGSELARGHARDPELARWRASRRASSEPCASCRLGPVCQGGCKIVSSFLGGGLGPDPECPRVVAFRREQVT
jgi:radical SAM protein with 4Fe4S-binding SPASM domain